MATKIIHPYFGSLDTSSVEGMWEGDHTNVLWEQEITYKDNLVLVDFWFTQGDDLYKERLDAFENFLKNLSKKEEEARKALRQYLKEHIDYFNLLKEELEHVPNDIETFVSQMEMEILDFWYSHHEGDGEEADIGMAFAFYSDSEDFPIGDDEIVSVKFDLSGEILSIDWDS